MTVEVKASLVRGSVFIAGEQVECKIQFTNVNPGNSAEMLAWASAQVLCQCTVTEARLKKLVARQNNTTDTSASSSAGGTGETSFVPNKGEQGFTVLSNKPTILFCNLLLRPGEMKTCIYRDSIPFGAPPSFRGATIKYAYKVVVGIQKVTMATQLLRLPLRVLSVPGLTEASVYQFSAEEVSASNPFTLPTVDNEESVLEAALHILSGLSADRQCSNYNISNARGFIVRFSLVKAAYKLGEDILGMFDFSQATVPCFQVTVTLQSLETSPGCSTEEQTPTVISFSQEHTFSLSIAHSPLSLHIPANVTPGFETDLVCLRWRLHFELVTLTSPLDEGRAFIGPTNQETTPAADQVYSWSPPATVDTETLVWTLPISVYPTNPTILSGQGQPPIVKIIC